MNRPAARYAARQAGPYAFVILAACNILGALLLGAAAPALLGSILTALIMVGVAAGVFALHYREHIYREAGESWFLAHQRARVETARRERALVDHALNRDL